MLHVEHLRRLCRVHGPIQAPALQLTWKHKPLSAARKRMRSGDRPGLQMWRILGPARVFKELALPGNPTIGVFREGSGRIMQWSMHLQSARKVNRPTSDLHYCIRRRLHRSRCYFHVPPDRYPPKSPTPKKRMEWRFARTGTRGSSSCARRSLSTQRLNYIFADWSRRNRFFLQFGGGPYYYANNSLPLLGEELQGSRFKVVHRARNLYAAHGFEVPKHRALFANVSDSQ
jgi:hypothetical protein